MFFYLYVLFNVIVGFFFKVFMVVVVICIFFGFVLLFILLFSGIFMVIVKDFLDVCFSFLWNIELNVFFFRNLFCVMLDVWMFMLGVMFLNIWEDKN